MPSSSAPPSSSPPPLNFGRKLAWGVGGFAENLANNAILSLAYPIYNVTLGLSPVLIGAALALSRIFDAVTDPLMGSLTDRTRSRWGRRRPWIALGAAAMAFFFALVWMVGRHWPPPVMFGYLAVLSCLFYLGYTVFVIPYSGLGIELAQGYEERTGLMTFRLVPSFVASLITQWLYALTQHHRFVDPVQGVRWVGLGTAVLIFATAIAPAIWCRERFAAQPAEHAGLWKSVQLTFANRPFRMVTGSAFCVFFGLFFVIPLTTYLTIYHVAGGDTVAGARISGVRAPSSPCSNLRRCRSSPGSANTSKTDAGAGRPDARGRGLRVELVAVHPAHPYYLIVPQALYQFGLCFCWVINGSFVADICDEDELQHGMRREGMFSAVFAFVYKCAVGIVALLSGGLISWAGFDRIGSGYDPQLMLRLRAAFVLIPSSASAPRWPAFALSPRSAPRRGCPTAAAPRPAGRMEASPGCSSAWAARGASALGRTPSRTLSPAAGSLLDDLRQLSSRPVAAGF